jgi:hypothetical protein
MTHGESKTPIRKNLKAPPQRTAFHAQLAAVMMACRVCVAATFEARSMATMSSLRLMVEGIPTSRAEGRPARSELAFQSLPNERRIFR